MTESKPVGAQRFFQHVTVHPGFDLGHHGDRVDVDYPVETGGFQHYASVDRHGAPTHT